MHKYMLNAKDICAILDVKESKAYSIIRAINESLNQKGILTVRGRVPRQYLYAAYGLREE